MCWLFFILLLFIALPLIVGAAIFIALLKASSQHVPPKFQVASSGCINEARGVSHCPHPCACLVNSTAHGAQEASVGETQHQQSERAEERHPGAAPSFHSSMATHFEKAVRSAQADGGAE